ncbi:MAG: sigma-70 family RNA polymerase sigma factor [Actinomycetota bacterium]
MHEDTTTPDEPIADADLILRTRSGDTEAFGELWRRHYPSGITVARSITSSIDADDLVQESYTRIYQAIIKGGGPNGSFRAYLFTSIRNTAAAWGRARRDTAIDELDTVADPDSTEHASNEALDRGLTAQAFRSLPTRWQEVLWYTEIEQMKPAEVGPLLGMKSGAVSQLAFRAREGLREAWIQAHLRNAAPGSECQWTIEHLGAYSRGNLSARDHKRLETHLDECARCMIVSAEAKDVSQRLALVLLPLVLGVAGTAAYLATLQGGGTPIVALAAMPSTVFEGGVVVGASGGAASGIAASTPGAGGGGAGGGAAAGGTAGGAAGTSGGILTGVGALVGAGSVTLVVAGVVAAAAIVPGLLTASLATSLATASEPESSTITTEVGPDERLDALEDQPLVIEVPEETEKPDEITQPDDLVPDVPEPDETAPDAPRTDTSGPGVSPAPEAPVSPAPPATPEPEEPTEPEPTPEPEEPTDPVDPNPEEPEEPTDPVDPTPEEPDGMPGVSGDLVGLIYPHYAIEITGISGSVVRVTLGDAEGYTDVAMQSATRTILLWPSLSQMCVDNVFVSFQYVDGDRLGEVLETRLWDLANPWEDSSSLAYEVCSVVTDAPSDESEDTVVPSDENSDDTETTDGEGTISTDETSRADTDGSVDEPVLDDAPSGDAPSEETVVENVSPSAEEPTDTIDVTVEVSVEDEPAAAETTESAADEADSGSAADTDESTDAAE